MSTERNCIRRAGRTVRPFANRAMLALTALAITAAPSSGLAQGKPVMAELLGAVETVEQKLVGLAEAIPADKYGWRPGEGVRSVGEVVMHVAADNYLLPAMAGTAAPAATGIKADDYSSVQKYEQTVPAKDAAIAAMKESFAHLRQAMAAVPEDRLGESVSMFGQQSSLLGLWVLTTTHLHEHLGQMIAYARSNSIVPPWSR